MEGSLDSVFLSELFIGGTGSSFVKRIAKTAGDLELLLPTVLRVGDVEDLIVSSEVSSRSTKELVILAESILLDLSSMTVDGT